MRWKIFKHNFFQFLVSFDQCINTLGALFSCLYRKHPRTSYADETISSVSWRCHLAGNPIPAKIIDTLLFFDKNHCKESYESERLGRQLPPELRPQIGENNE